MKLTVKNDFRKFKAGDEYIFTSFDNERKNDTDTRILYIVGDNGTGKSTLMKAMRSLYYSDRNVIENNKVENSNLKLEVNECASHIELEGFDKYEMVIALDGELDDNMRYECAQSASDFVDSGAYHMRHMSNGTRSAMIYVNLIQKYKEKIIPGKTLVLLDEVDKGWMIKYTTTIGDQLRKNFPGCDIIIVTHNPLCWLSDILDKSYIYDIESKSYVNGNEYFYSKTSLHISCSYVDYEELIDKLSDKNKKLTDLLEKYKEKFGEIDEQ